MSARNLPYGMAVGFLTAFLLTSIPPCTGRADSARVIGSLFASAVISDDRFVIVGDRGRIFLSEDGAKTWTLVDSGTKYALSSVCFPDDQHGWTAGQAGVLLRSADAGRTWQAQSGGVREYLLDVDFVDAHHGIAVGTETTVLMTADGGATWEQSPLKTSTGMFEDINLFAAAMVDGRHACVAGDMGRIFFTEDGGQSWSESKSPFYDEQTMTGKIVYALAYDSGVLYAAGIDSALATSKDQGRSWTEGNTGFSTPDLYGIDVVGGIGLAAGSGGHVIRTSDGGATWHGVEVPEKITRFWLSGVDLTRNRSGEVNGLVVGERGTFGLFADGAIRW